MSVPRHQWMGAYHESQTTIANGEIYHHCTSLHDTCTLGDHSHCVFHQQGEQAQMEGTRKWLRPVVLNSGYK